MNPVLENRIKAAGRRLLELTTLYGDSEKARMAQDELAALRDQRTPEDHAEMAERLGLPKVVA